MDQHEQGEKPVSDTLIPLLPGLYQFSRSLSIPEVKLKTDSFPYKMSEAAILSATLPAPETQWGRRESFLAQEESYRLSQTVSGALRGGETRPPAHSL